MPQAINALLDGDSDRQTFGEEIYRLASQIFPITRSITGNGVRQTLAILQQHIPIEVHEVASGTPVFDWIVPNEWNLRQAYIADSSGRRIIDTGINNLHVVSHSIPVNTRMSLAELKPHLHSLPDKPDLIPYRTSYYTDNWGFCLSHKQLSALPEDNYEIVVDATLSPGSMTYGEFYKAGNVRDEIVLTAHVCHPSLANDNCSGIALLTTLAKQILQKRTRYSYRVLFAPGTIGAIAWLSRNQQQVSRIRHGLVVSNVGDFGGPIYKRSRRSNADIDRAAELVLNAARTTTTEIRDFTPYGYDERQYCSPGFNLPFGSFQCSAWGEFPEYHTSGDNLAFISPEALDRSIRMIADIIDTLEKNDIYVNLKPYCEPQLGRAGIYETPGTPTENQQYRMALLWVLNDSDGTYDLLDIAKRSKIPYQIIAQAALRLEHVNLIAKKANLRESEA